MQVISKRHFLMTSVLISGAIGLSTLLLLISKYAREQAREANCRGNLHQIRSALQLYHETYGRFPPVVSSKGIAKHSWRGLVQTFEPGHQKYSVNEDWDSDWNRQTTASTGAYLWQCPNLRPLGNFTSYVAIAPACTPDQFVVIELSHTDIEVFEPRDFNSDGRRGLEDIWVNRAHPAGVHLLVLQEGHYPARERRRPVETLTTINDLETQVTSLIKEAASPENSIREDGQDVK